MQSLIKTLSQPINWKEVGLLEGIDDENLKRSLSYAYDCIFNHLINSETAIEEEINYLAIMRRIYSIVSDFQNIDPDDIIGAYQEFCLALPIDKEMYCEEVLNLGNQYCATFTTYYLSLFLNEMFQKSEFELLTPKSISTIKNLAVKRQQFNFASELRDLEKNRNEIK